MEYQVYGRRCQPVLPAVPLLVVSAQHLHDPDPESHHKLSPANDAGETAG